jgi:hypothetical protein
MKKLLALLTLTAFSATAQVQLLDGTTPHTNSTTTSANINVPSKGWTNVPYSTTNYIYITFGDGLPASATTKLNSDLVYLTNQLALALQLPNQINTNWQAAVGAQSNRINVVIVNIATISNQLTTTMATVAAFPGANINNGSVNSNKFDGGTMSWLNSMPTSPGNNLLDKYYSYGSANYVPVADGSGQWAWATPPWPSTMSFDSGNITSDGSGNASFVSIFAQQLKDSGYSTGSADYYAKANGSGGWYWTQWPTTLNYDSGTITSDGSGNLAATSFRGSLLDNGWSSGPSGYIPVANGDGTWTWTFSGGGGGGTFINNYYVASNSVVSSQTYTSLATNFNVGSSNYLGQFTNVISYAGQGPQYTIPSSGMTPGGYGNTPLNFYWSTNGSTWSTNLPAAPNVVYAAVTCISNGLSSVTITSATHPETYGRTNDLTQQITRVAEPVGPSDAVPKYYCDNSIAAATANNWKSDGTNYYYGGVKIAVPVLYYNAISTPVIDSTGTNYAVSIIVTNFIAGWQFQVQTNLALPFYTPSYTLTTNSGVATFKVPAASMPGPTGFFRVVSPQPGSIRFDNGPIINVTTNQIVWGATNTAPANTSTPVAWISVQVSGRTNTYRMPLYQ